MSSARGRLPAPMYALWACALLLSASAMAFGVTSGPTTVRAAPSADPPITAVVVRRALEQIVTLTCAAEAADEVSVLSEPPYGGYDAVITRLPKQPSVAEGDLIAEVSGRPVIALTGSFRRYRDLRPGDRGPDVLALQSALRRLGLYGGATDGRLGRSTAVAVRRLYARLGYQAAAEVPDPVVAPTDGDTEAGAVAPQAAAGVLVVPRNELLFLSTLPLQRVGTVSATPGSTDSAGRLLALTTRPESLMCRGTGSEDVRTGMAATILVSGERFAGSVTGTGVAPAADDSAPSSELAQPSVVVAPRARETSFTAGQEAIAEVTLAKTASAVLAVPVGAVGGAGDAAELAVVRAGEIRKIPVTIGLVAAGLVEVVADPDELREGDEVVVGPYTQQSTER